MAETKTHNGEHGNKEQKDKETKWGIEESNIKKVAHYTSHIEVP